MEHFYTLQGEGFHQGKAAYFIRLGGCDVGCVWCDVKESWEADKHKKIKIENLKLKIKETPAQVVVITGGEPLMYNLDEWTKELQTTGLKTHLETSGAYPLTGHWDWICVSPKKFKAPVPEILPKANELKVIIFNKSDFAWAEKYAVLVSKDCKLYVQPEWDKAVEMMPFIIEYIKENPKWELSLQIHKYINVP
ncbi:MAG: 7-carboxy-7-deazaguanine synthase QueE [Bacteroidetes bacterium]|nr:7-carboxy-7-deazaguanine synthase QueE [Bacteroidota bacterium]MBS1929505.1 7-carboxy-7-deazaguanine synthase QueE [Bacteroidota bacterium]